MGDSGQVEIAEHCFRAMTVIVTKDDLAEGTEIPGLLEKEMTSDVVLTGTSFESMRSRDGSSVEVVHHPDRSYPVMITRNQAGKVDSIVCMCKAPEAKVGKETAKSFVSVPGGRHVIANNSGELIKEGDLLYWDAPFVHEKKSNR